MEPSRPKKPDIWMPLYVADYLADTAYLTTEQHGAYLLMLMAYWRNGPIPDNDAIIATITRQTPDAWSIARAVLEPMFHVSGGFWTHKRVEQEFDKAQKNREAAHAKAAKAAAARWGKEKMLGASPEAMPEGMPHTMLGSCPSPSPSPTQEQQDQKQGRAPRSQPVSVVLPDWMPADTWQAWVAHRKAIRKPINQRTADKSLATLTTLRSQGFDPVAVVKQSIDQDWTGLFPLKNGGSNGHAAPGRWRESPAARAQREIDEHQRQRGGGLIIDS